MRWLKTAFRRCKVILLRERVESELDDELRFHLERQITTNVAAGMAPEVARRVALQEFGGVEQHKEECRDVRGTKHLETLAADLRYGFRALRKNPGFAVISILTLTLGIGANTAIFSMVNALLLHPYPFHDLDRLVRVWEDRGEKSSYDARRIAPADAEDLRAGVAGLASVTTYELQSFNSSIDGNVAPILGSRVSANFFDVLDVGPTMGRLFTTMEEQPGSDQVALISHGLWMRQFGGMPGVLGRALRLNGRTYTIVGVMPKDFDYPVPVEIWVPLALSPGEKADRSRLSLEALARLGPRVSPDQANAALESISRRLSEDFPQTNRGRTVAILELRKELYEFTLPLFLLLQIAAGLVLLLACANLANLTFARMLGRQKEIALRAALGAGRARLAQLFLCETLLLSLVSGAVAIIVSLWSVKVLRTSIPVEWTKWVPGWNAIQVDRTVLGFTVGLAALVGLFFGLATALHGTRAEINKNLKEAGAGSISPAKAKLRSALVIAQVAFALVLLICAGLTIQGFTRLAAVYQGFEPAGVLEVEIALPDKTYPEGTRIREFYERVLQAARALPGVRTAALITNPPASNVDSETAFFTTDGRASWPANELPSADLQTATPDYFNALRIPLIAGRFLSDSDREGSEPVVVISRSVAARYFPSANALGHKLKLGAQDAAGGWFSVVGVVGDVRQNWWNPTSRPVIYKSFLQSPEGFMTLLLRSTRNPMAQVGPVREIVQKIDPEIALRGINTLEQEVADSIAIVRILGILMGVFGGVALALSSVGVCGVLSESVAQRTREIGIRLALGANPSDLLRLVLRQSLRLTGIGLAIALPVAFVVSRMMEKLILGIVRADSVVLAGFAVLFIVVAFCAGFLPARRAMRLDPMTCLRYE